MSLVSNARLFAIAAHEAIGQKRKYTQEPYWHHCRAVATILSVYADSLTEEMSAAAWLHDTVEDTAVTHDVIREHFGEAVSNLVYELTEASKPEDGNRAVRKAIDREFLAGVSPQAKTIKLADLIDNSASIKERDPQFARVYLEEKRLLLPVLNDGNAVLFEMAQRTLAA